MNNSLQSMCNSTQPVNKEMIKQLDSLNILVKTDPSMITPELVDNINNLAGIYY